MGQSPQNYEYEGVIHVHSTFSDGSGTIPEILNAATHLDYLILTDHHTLQSKKEGWEGWHGNCLLIIGEEVSSSHGDCLCLGTQREIPPQEDGETLLQEVGKQNGLSFLAHPHGTYKPLFKKIDHSWKKWESESFDGIELWSYMFDWIENFRYYSWWKHYYFPDNEIEGPAIQTLKQWDKICQKRRCAAIAGLDAHAKKIPPLIIFPYKTSFQTLKTHIFLKEPLSKTNKDIPKVLEALQKGNAFLGFDKLAPSRGTRFEIPSQNIAMGDETHFRGPTKMLAETPHEADIRIIKNGKILKEFKTKRKIELAIDTEGVYRMEAHLENKPWIYTNPIYLR
jgi:hypothetical protein